MSRLIDMTGRRFGKLTVLRLACPTRAGWQAKWVCACDCGGERDVFSGRLRSGEVSCCGCSPGRRQSHGLTGTRVHRTWLNMVARCTDPSSARYRDYGARGIAVCDEWRYSLERFVRDMGMPKPGMTIERIDNDGNYEPGNCRWATMTEQCNNTRRNLRVEYNGESVTVAQLSRLTGINYGTLKSRVKAGWPIARVVSQERYPS